VKTNLLDKKVVVRNNNLPDNLTQYAGRTGRIRAVWADVHGKLYLGICIRNEVVTLTTDHITLGGRPKSSKPKVPK
jgi:hypothetical protein